MNNPIKQHYIPRFVLRPFCKDKEILYYYDKRTTQIDERSIADIFMNKDLYTDDQNAAKDPYHIEKDLAKFESEASSILKRMLDQDDILITTEEDAMLKLFLAIMGFRAERMKQFFTSMSQTGDDLYSMFLKNENFLDLWRRNLGEIVKCRSIREVIGNSAIDEPFKIFMHRDTESIAGRFFVIAERRGKEDFIIGDCYPLETIGETEWGSALPMHSIFPISSQRILISAANGITSAPSYVMELPYSLFKKPTKLPNHNTIRIHVQKIYELDVKRINKLIFDASEYGVAFKDKEKISIDKFNPNLK